MRAIIFFFSILLILPSCNSDFLLSRQMVGEYKVNLETSETKQEIEGKRQKIAQKTEEAKRKIDESIEKKKSEIDKEAPFAEGLRR